MAGIVIDWGNNRKDYFPIFEETVVGRDPAVEIHLPDLSISRKHAKITMDQAVAVLQDLDSKNGTFCNDKRLKPGQKWTLKEGDRIRFGEINAVFHAGRKKEEHDLTSFSAITLTPDNQPDRLSLLLHLAQAVTNQSDPEIFIEHVLNALEKAIDFDHALLALDREDLFGRKIQKIRNRTTKKDQPLVISRTVLNKVQHSRQAVLVTDALDDTDLNVAQSVVISKLRSILCVPILSGSRMLGTLYLENRAKVAAFNEEDLRFVSALGILFGSMINASFIIQTLQHRIEEGQQGKTEIIGSSPIMQKVMSQAHSFASKGNAPVLITGESGTGKELIARFIHETSDRRNKPYVVFNCAAIPDSLVESELFGHTKGAFTHAVSNRKGKFELADGGTIFLDEVADLSLDAQAKLLRTLQEGEVTPVGSEKTIHVDVRVLSATNKDLSAMIQQGAYRQDLLFRMNVLQINLPPLRDRPEDIRELADHFLHKLKGKITSPVGEISKEAISFLESQPWPGNARQLANWIERTLYQADVDVLQPEDFSECGTTLSPANFIQPSPGQDEGKLEIEPPARESMEEPSSVNLKEAVADLEKRKILQALEQTHWNKSQAAKILGISRKALQQKMERFKIT